MTEKVELESQRTSAPDIVSQHLGGRYMWLS